MQWIVFWRDQSILIRYISIMRGKNQSWGQPSEHLAGQILPWYFRQHRPLICTVFLCCICSTLTSHFQGSIVVIILHMVTRWIYANVFRICIDTDNMQKYVIFLELWDAFMFQEVCWIFMRMYGEIHGFHLPGFPSMIQTGARGQHRDMSQILPDRWGSSTMAGG